MKQAFLSYLAEQITTENQDLRKVCVVLPGKRTSLFLKRELKKQLPPNSWLPKFTTLSQLFEQLSPYQKLGNLDQMAFAYRAYQSRFEEPEAFSQFLSWGTTMLADFNEIDHHLLDHTAVFEDLRKIKYLENWSFNSTELSEMQDQFLKFWTELPHIFETWKSNMLDTGQLNGGGIARHLAETSPELPFDHIYVAGMNALTPAELQVIKSWQGDNKASVYFNADPYYVMDADMEAGIFVRKAQQKLSIKLPPARLGTSPMEVHYVSCSSLVAETKWTMSQLAELDSEQLENTALILPDESMLPMIINSIPDQVAAANISMGLPLKNTPVYGFVKLFLKCTCNGQKRVHFKDVLDLIRHPYVQTPSNSELLQALEDEIIKKNLVFLNLKTPEKYDWDQELINWWNPIAKANQNKTIKDIDAALRSLIQQGLPSADSERFSDKLQRESCNKVTLLLDRVHRYHDAYGMLESYKEFEKIFLSLLHKEKLDIIGEPLEGIQILGLLESRALDFERVFLFSCNEGVLPKKNYAESYLPADVRAHYGLPSYLDKEAIYASYFYSTVQRCKEVHMMYTDGEKSMDRYGEMSRYLKQFEFHFPQKKDQAIKIEQHALQFETGSQASDIKPIEMAPWMLDRIKEQMKNGFSPSAIDKWITCNRGFFYRYILGLGEQDDVEEQIEFSTFGTVVHDSLEKLFFDYIGKQIQEADITKMKLQAPSIIQQMLEKHYPGDLMNSGPNLLSRKVIETYVDSILEMEKDRKQGTILSLEEGLSLQLDGENPMLLKGKADRIDEVNGTIQVIDYKTGKVARKDVTVKSIEELGEMDKSKARQLMIYALMAEKKYESIRAIVPGIISMRNKKDGFLEFKVAKQAYYELNKQELIDWLLDLQKGILSTKEIQHNPDSKHCDYCVSLTTENE